MTAAIPADAAAWIRDVVLPVAYRRGTTDPATCPCQWSPCGHCNAGRHDKCPRTTWPGHGKPDPDTYIVSRDGAALTPVWRAGKACRWLCPCPCSTELQALFPAPARVAPRSSSTAGGNGYIRIASTDHLHRDEDLQPALLEIAL